MDESLLLPSFVLDVYTAILTHLSIPLIIISQISHLNYMPILALGNMIDETLSTWKINHTGNY